MEIIVVLKETWCASNDPLKEEILEIKEKMAIMQINQVSEIY